MRKPRILIMSDSPAIHTGFANVIRHICMSVHETGLFDLNCIGWFHDRPDHSFPFDIIKTDTANPQAHDADKYALNTFPAVVDKWRPDIVLCVGDPWMLEAPLSYKAHSKYKLAVYTPCDGEPFSKKFTNSLKRADVIVAYGPYGKTAMLRTDRSIAPILKAIPHGVDLDVYKPMPDEERSETKKKISKSGFVVGTVSRNQPRKNLPAMFKAFKMFVGEYFNCSKCGRLMFVKEPACDICGCDKFAHGDGKKDCSLYFHGAVDDCGWDLFELTDRLGLAGRVGYPQGMRVGAGTDEQTLATIYNSFDIFTLPTLGEGFGMPISEAMACGTPCLVTNHSAHLDYCVGASDLISISDFMTEPLSNIERALVDVYDYAMRLDRMFMDEPGFMAKWGSHAKESGFDKDPLWGWFGKPLRDELGRRGVERMGKYSWPDVCEQWIKLFTDMAGGLDLSSDSGSISAEVV